MARYDFLVFVQDEALAMDDVGAELTCTEEAIVFLPQER